MIDRSPSADHPGQSSRRAVMGLLAIIVLAGCGVGPVDRTDLANEYRELGIDFDERELNDDRDAYTSDLSGDDPFVELIGDPVVEMSIVLFDVDGADFESTDFGLAEYVAPAEHLIPNLRSWIVETFDEEGAGEWSDSTENGDWVVEAEFSDDWLTTGVGALDMHFVVKSED